MNPAHKRWRSGLFLISLLAGVGSAHAQISPGELSSAHASLEGIANCTSCHTVGKTLSNENCLGCHEEIRVRIAAHKGYHASIGDKTCAECHREHHGRDFPLIQLDTASFDHARIGFALTGKHAAIPCRNCHVSKLIRTTDILRLSADRKVRTYLGLGTNCASCHEDRHEGQFKQPCNACHTTEGWKPASGFSHSGTMFPLTGKHTSVECAQCHKTRTADGRAVLYAKLPHEQCTDCHANPHSQRIRKPCESCHTTDGWRAVPKTAFDHSATAYPLTGKHREVACERCHRAAGRKTGPASAGFRIERFEKCGDCHADAHDGQFGSTPVKQECRRCHSEEGFLPPLFSVVDHRKTRFPLEGAHAAIPCAGCHQRGFTKTKSTARFRWPAILECRTCHTDPHSGQFNSWMTDGCTTCHNASSWTPVRFTHDVTGFSLRGGHASISCRACHLPADPAVPSGLRTYKGTPRDCEGCHRNPHGPQFADAGHTACQRCHEELGWKQLRFNHRTDSRFPLTGKHASLSCDKCHRPGMLEGQERIIYKPLGVECISCHPAQR